MTRRYTAVAQRSGRWWAIHVPDVAGVFTQARTLREGRDMARSALSLALDVAPDALVVVLEVQVDDPDAARLGGGVTSLLAGVTDRQRIAQQAATEAAEASREAAAALRRAGLTLGDTGELLGVSYQRVQQLLAGRSEARSPTRDRDGSSGHRRPASIRRRGAAVSRRA